MNSMPIKALVLIVALSFSSLSHSDALNFEVDPKAELSRVSMYQKNVRKASEERLVVFDVMVKNTDTVAHLYSVTVLIPGVGAGEGFAPAEGETLVNPGEEAEASVAVLSPQFPTNGYSIIVKAVESR